MPDEQQTEAAAVQTDEKVVLVVDDQQPMRELMRAAIESLPFPCTVKEATDADSAVKFVHEQTPDLVLLDIVLVGSNTSGVLICNQLCREGARVVIVSGQASKAIVQACLSSGAIGYLPKPFSVETLREKLTEWLG